MLAIFYWGGRDTMMLMPLIRVEIILLFVSGLIRRLF